MAKTSLTPKTIEIFAGPNGSGKSTFAESFFLQNKQSSPLFINSDVIATGISPLDVDAVAFTAGRIMLEAIHSNINAGNSISFETTLSGKTWAPVLKEAKANGYQITIYFIYLERVQENLKRIKERIRRGGHAVPEQTVRRRYPKSISHFWNLYRPLADHWFIFNNSKKKPKLVQSLESFTQLSTAAQQEFAKHFTAKAKDNS